ncbi:phage tail tape measure protein [Acetobacter persici]|uniref:phage tail tape measure protein n=1 Tax=Acetobacter persici TaxID=1076596 RepID=UPI0020CE6F87|nr:phage tail tape measure protein [Acetobacter persici]MCP9320102.1 phage tail tape measure protein [Acetobacter persici]
MSGSLTAALRLTLKDEASSGVKALDEVFNRLNATLERLSTALAPLASLTDALTKTTEGTARLDAALEASTTATRRVTEATRGASVAIEMMGSAFGGATWQVTELSASLGELAGAEESVGVAGEAMGGEIVAGAERATLSVEALMARVRALHEVLGRNSAPAFGGVGAGIAGWAGDVHQAGRGFADSLQGSMHHGMNAAMATLAMLEPVHANADFGNALTHIGLTLGLHGQANSSYAAALGTQINDWARQYGQKGTDLVEAATFLNQEGYSQERMNALVPVIGQISTAYNAHPDAVARTAFALNQNLGVATPDTSIGLAMLARVGKMSALPFEELAPLFPELASSAAGVGVKGLDQVADLGGMLALIRKNTGTSGEATTALRAFIETISSPHARHRFDRYGIDLNKTVLAAQHTHSDPLAAVLNSVMRIGDADKRYTAIGDLFGNERDQLFVRAMTRDWGQYASMRDDIHRTSPAMIGEDYDTARQNSPLTKLNAFNESLAQINRRVGVGFQPAVDALTSGLNHVNEAFEQLDKHTPGLTNKIIGVTGGVLALTAATAALGVVWGPLKAGFLLVRTALSGIALAETGATAGLASFLGVSTAAAGGIVAAFVGVGVAIADIALHWSRFSGSFRTLGHGLMEEARGLGNVLAGALHFDWQRILAGMGQGMRGIGTAWSGAWGIVKQLALDFTRWLDGWGAGIPLRILSALTAEWHVLTDGIAGQIGRMETAFDTSWLGRHMGMAAPVPAGAPAHVPTPAASSAARQSAQFGVHVSADRGLTVRQVSGPQTGMTIAPQNTGRMVGRP